jgi:negative regulator of flagellin synthesis FlgM
MTDAINNYGQRAQSDATLRSALDKTNRKNGSTATAQGSIPAPLGGAVSTAGADELHLSNVTARAMGEPDFDRVKVESIKQAIKDGQYPLNPRKIAESFHAIEQMIRE